MTTGDVLAPELKEELVAAADAILTALADGGGVESDARAAVRTLEAYLEQQQRISEAAKRHRSAGLHAACAAMNVGLVDLLARATALSDQEWELLCGWPGALMEYCADPTSPAAASGLVAQVTDPVWASPLPRAEADALARLMAAAGVAVGGPGEPAAGDSSTIEPELGGDEAECGWLREQVVSGDLLALLAEEIEGARASLRQALDAACSADDASARDAADQVAEEIARVGAAAEAVGLAALSEFLNRLKLSFAARGSERPTARQREVLALFPGALAAYLAAPADRSAAEGLVDLLRSDAWAPSLAEPECARLVRALGLVQVSNAAVTAPARPSEATAEEVSLAFPADLNQELLDGLLLELPVQTGEFSAAMQNIAGGHGSLADIDLARRAAHTLKGAANTVGVRGIANLTHHLEDILVALSACAAMPGGGLGECLVRASDCLEAMSEAVTGAGPEPGDAVAVLQEVLNWANKIDRDGVPETDEPAGNGGTPVQKHPEQDAGGAAAPSPSPMVRVPAALIDELLRLVGETTIAAGQIRERLLKLERSHQSMRDQAGSLVGLSNELEELVDIGAGAGPARAQVDSAAFDPLEFERYGELHTVSRRLIESATDARELGLGIEEELVGLIELAETQERLQRQTQAAVMQTRMVPVATVLSRLQRGVRQACRLLDKEAGLSVTGAETPIDSNILGALIDPLMHVLRNAVDHGIEPALVRTAAGKPGRGEIRLDFAREGNQIVVRCQDDGAGLDLAAIRRSAEERGLVTADEALSDGELTRLIVTPGFSTRDEATQVSGRGIGMDIVRSRIQQMKGSLSLRSTAGKGLTVEMRVPAAMIATQALIVRSRANRLAISSHGVREIRYVLPEELKPVAGSATYRIGDSQLEVVELEALFGLPADRRLEPRRGFPLLIVRLDSGVLRAVRVQEVLQSREFVVKALGQFVPKLRGVVGATILGDGSVAPVLDLPDAMAVAVMAPWGRADVAGAPPPDDHRRAATAQRTALVVDDSLSARRATAQFLRDAGFVVRTAIDGLEAVSILEKWKPDVMLVDMEMPRMNGLELTAHVRGGAPPLAQAPIIMITSRSTAKHRRQAEAAGVSVYLTKPFADEELLEHLTRLTPVPDGL